MGSGHKPGGEGQREDSGGRESLLWDGEETFHHPGCTRTQELCPKHDWGSVASRLGSLGELGVKFKATSTFSSTFSILLDGNVVFLSSVMDQVISARKGEFETGFEKGGQTREHAMLAKTAGVKHLIVLVNKMDDSTVNWSLERFWKKKFTCTTTVILDF